MLCQNGSISLTGRGVNSLGFGWGDIVCEHCGIQGGTEPYESAQCHLFCIKLLQVLCTSVVPHIIKRKKK